MTAWVGTSGWHYKDWRGRFYPPGLAAGRWLEYYAARFDTVELNNAFYRLPPATTFAGWRQRTPAGFVVAVKASRYLTHVKRLKDPAEPVERLMSRAAELGDRLGPVLLQLPPNLPADAAALDRTLACFAPTVRVAVEARHPTWFSGEVRSLLERRGAAWVLADGGAVEPPVWVTSGWSYVRFHRGTGSPPTCYTPASLRRWAARLAEVCGPSMDVYCYFNNDPGGCAVRDARRFAGFLADLGLHPTRVPGPRETRLRPVSGPAR